MIIFNYNTIMSFWKRVDCELDYQGISRKEFSFQVGINPSLIAKGLQIGSIPSAETAVKIAKVLGVSVEYLVNGTETPKSTSTKETEQNQLRLYRKYHHLIEKMESFSEQKQTLVNNLVNDLEKL